MPIVNPANLIGKVFTMDFGDSGESYQSSIAETIENHLDVVSHNLEHFKFKCFMSND